MDCSCGFQEYVTNCEGVIYILTQNLEPNTEHKIVITDKFGKEYSVPYETDADSTIIMEASSFPEGLFNVPGELKIEIYTTNGVYNSPIQCEKVKLLIGKYYDHINLEVRAGTNVKSNIGCLI